MPKYLVSGSCNVPFEYEVEASCVEDALREGALRALSEVDGAVDATPDEAILDE